MAARAASKSAGLPSLVGLSGTPLASPSCCCVAQAGHVPSSFWRKHVRRRREVGGGGGTHAVKESIGAASSLIGGKSSGTCRWFRFAPNPKSGRKQRGLVCGDGFCNNYLLGPRANRSSQLWGWRQT